MGKLRTVIPLVVVLGLSAVAALAVYQWFQQRTATVRQPPVELAQFAVAAVDIPWGTRLNRNMVRFVPCLKDGVPAGAFTSPESLDGRVTVSPIAANELISLSRLAPTTVTEGGVAAIVTHGKRAVSVRGNKVLGIAGYLHPGNRVDVLVTISDPAKTDGHMTKVVLENILVLTSGSEVAKKPEKEDTSAVDVYTLEVTPEEAEKLSLAATNGTLHFALRNYLDADQIYTAGATPETMLASYRVASASAVAAAPAPQPEISQAPPAALEIPQQSKYMVDIIRGTTTQQVTF